VKRWSPRRELTDRLPCPARQTWADVRLLLRVLVAIGIGGETRCNRALDVLIEHQELRYPEPGHEPFNPDPRELEAPWR